MNPQYIWIDEWYDICQPDRENKWYVFYIKKNVRKLVWGDGVSLF